VSDTHDDVQHSVTAGDLRQGLAALEWSKGLTRDQIRRKFGLFPEDIYLRLPAKKLYFEPATVLHDAQVASSRAEGEFLGAAPDLPEAESRDEGGPPAWGPDPLFTPGGFVDGSSAEDRDPDDVND
jgi:hypothetical protein